jgi:hypothetical protein
MRLGGFVSQVDNRDPAFFVWPFVSRTPVAVACYPCLPGKLNNGRLDG